MKIEAVVQDANNDGEGQIKSDFCRQTNISKIDLNVALYLDRQQFPPWMNLDINWLKSEIKKANLKPELSFVSANQPTSSNNDLYTLFEKNDTNLDIQNLYQINLMLKLDKAQNETFFVQNKKLSMAFTSEILRNGQIIENGQMLLDQVRSTSKAGILSYKILKEEKKNKTYYVKIEAVVQDTNHDSEGQIKSDFCRQTNISAVNLDLALYLDRQKLISPVQLAQERFLIRLN